MHRIPLKAYPFLARLGKWSVFILDPIVYSCFIQPTMFFTIAVSNKSVMKSGRLKYSDISIKWDCKLLLPLQFKSNDLIDKMKLRIFFTYSDI